jgi:uncharacterized protein GlcG (DUF336 family)
MIRTRRTMHMVASLALTLLAVPVTADSALVSFRALTPETALEIASAALASCRDDGFQVSVAVVDRSGIVQVLLRDRFSGPHANEAAHRKAWTAVSFREATLTLAERTGPDTDLEGVRAIEGVLMLGGGIPISASGSVVGGVGVAGAFTPEADHACAQAGIDAVMAELELAD